MLTLLHLDPATYPTDERKGLAAFLADRATWRSLVPHEVVWTAGARPDRVYLQVLGEAWVEWQQLPPERQARWAEPV